MSQYHVAVVGAGPAGLYAAKTLSERGVSVSLFNRDIKPGGLAEYGIYHDKFKMKEGLRKQFRSLLHDCGIRYYGNVTIGMIGKYVELTDSYKSLNEALTHGGVANNVKVKIRFIESELLMTTDDWRDELADLDAILVPGGFGKRGIAGMLRAIQYARENGTPFFGICLGMQLLFQDSEESPGAAGLGLIPGSIVRFRTTLVVPHIGWNDVLPVAPSTLLAPDGGCFYFVHSFHAGATPDAVGTTEYGVTFTSVVEKQNVFGVQFHPEKSQAAGIELLRRFAAFDKEEGRA